jgi:hypothetical protein
MKAPKPVIYSFLRGLLDDLLKLAHSFFDAVCYLSRVLEDAYDAPA